MAGSRVRTTPTMRIVHEGRGGFIEIDDHRYVIEHVEGGRFCIHFPSGHRHANRDADLAALRRLVDQEPTTWTIEDRSRREPVT